MYKYKKAMRLVIGVLLVTLVLSACAKPTPEPTEAVATEAPTEAAPEVAEEVPEAPACPPSTVADPMGVPAGEWPQQFELAEFEELADCKMTFSENPLFAGQGLPPVEERLPEEPLVVQPYDETGTYGGRIRGVSIALESGTSEIISWHQPSAVRFSDDMKTIVPDVFKSWEWNEDFTAITFHLRKGHKWSDGEPFTADDIVFWWTGWMLNEELWGGYIPSQWKPGGEPAKVEKIDDTTVKFEFALPNPALLPYLAITFFNPWAPKHYLEKYHREYNPEVDELAEEQGFENWTELFGQHWHPWEDARRAPFVPTLSSHMIAEEPTSEDRLFVVNPYYFKVDTAGQQLPYINEHYESFISNREVFNLKIIAGEVDFKGQSLELEDYPLLKENEDKANYTVQVSPGTTGPSNILAFNRTTPDPVLREIFRDPRWNQAMSLAINREELNELVFLGMGEPYQAVPEESVSFVDHSMVTYMTEYDPERANELLDEMGLERGADGWRLRPDGEPLVLLYEWCMQLSSAKLNELVREYWEDVGVQIQLKEDSTEDLRSRLANNEVEVTCSSDIALEIHFQMADPGRMYPAFGGTLSQLSGVPWRQWYETDGKEGEEPPPDAKRLFELWEELQKVGPGSDQYMEIGKEMVQIHLDNLYMIGTVGEVKVPTVISNRLGNVPPFTVQLSIYARTRSFRPDQWYVKE